MTWPDSVSIEEAERIQEDMEIVENYDPEEPETWPLEKDQIDSMGYDANKAEVLKEQIETWRKAYRKHTENRPKTCH
jgi:erythromycin esterase-like protein